MISDSTAYEKNCTFGLDLFDHLEVIEFAFFWTENHLNFLAFIADPYSWKKLCPAWRYGHATVDYFSVFDHYEGIAVAVDSYAYEIVLF